MKLNKKLRTFLLIATLSLGIGIIVYAGTSGSRTFSGNGKTGKATSQYTVQNKIGSVTAETYKSNAASSDRVTVVVASYDSAGKVLATGNANGSLQAVKSIIPGSKWVKAVSTHAVTSSSYSPYCSISLTVTPK